MILTGIKNCGRANFDDVAFFIEDMSPNTRIYQSAHDSAPDLENTVCEVIEGWHRGKWDEQDRATCRLRFMKGGAISGDISHGGQWEVWYDTCV